MAILTVHNLSINFGERILFDNISFDVESHDKIGFIGANGVGKTTLFKIITEEMKADKGNVVKGKDLKIGYMKQHGCTNPNRSVYLELLSVFEYLEEIEKEIESIAHKIEAREGNIEELVEKQVILHETYEKEGGLTYKSRTRAALVGLGFTQEDMQMGVGKISGGQLSKLSLAKLLLSKSNFLLLDEPTNHLDIKSVEWLETFIREFKGGVIVISHDRYFLDGVTNKTIEIENKKAIIYKGNYTTYIKKKDEMKEAIKNKYENDIKEVKRIEGIIAKQKKFGQAHNYITIASKQKQIDRVKNEIIKPEEQTEKISFKLRVKKESGQDVLICRGIEKKFGEKEIFREIDMHIRKGERIFLIGANGCGKTTLLKTIAGKYETRGEVIKGANVKIGYFDQVQEDINIDNTVLEEVWDTFPKMSETKIRTGLGVFMFKGDEVYKEIKTLSGGERAKIALLKLMLRGANFLLLDEPTNHLDTTSREELEKTLSEYGGTMLVISHDRYFINKLADKIITLKRDRIEESIGDYDRYIENESKKKIEKVTEEKKEKKMNNEYFIKKELKSNKRKAQTRLNNCEKEIEETENKIERLEKEIEKEEVATNFEKLTQITKELDELRERNDELFIKWEKLQEELEELNLI